MDGHEFPAGTRAVLISDRPQRKAGYGTRMDAKRDKVLRTFLNDGQLVAIPARAAKRRVVLEHIVRAFEPGIRLRERDVDAVLRAFYEPDWVTLRRLLIDEGLMSRADGWYWRSGGAVDV